MATGSRSWMSRGNTKRKCIFAFIFFILALPEFAHFRAMNLSEIQFILSNLEARGKLRRLEGERLRGMTPEEVCRKKMASH